MGATTATSTSATTKTTTAAATTTTTTQIVTIKDIANEFHKQIQKDIQHVRKRMKLILDIILPPKQQQWIIDTIYDPIVRPYQMKLNNFINGPLVQPYKESLVNFGRTSVYVLKHMSMGVYDMIKRY